MKKYLVIVLDIVIIIQFSFIGQFLNLQKAKAATPAEPKWADSTVTAPNYSIFQNTAVDASGNIYAVGYINDNQQFDFGNSVTVTGGYTGGIFTSLNAVIVKYSSAGLAQWANSTAVGPNASAFTGVIADNSNNIYAVGYITGNSQFDFGNSITVTGANAGSNAVIVKYSSAGLAQWANSTAVGPSSSLFSSVTVDNSNNIYTVGFINSNGQFGFGNSVTVTGGYTGGMFTSYNAVIVKYSSAGLAQWADSTVVGPGQSSFTDVAVNTSGNIYTSGYITGNNQFDFGNSVTVTGANAGLNALIVKYNSAGSTQWANSTVVGPNTSNFDNITIDDSDNIYVSGYITGNSQFDFGNGVTVTGKYGGGFNPLNALIMQYSSTGLAQWAESVVIGPDISEFNGIANDASGNIYGAGFITSNSQFDFGNGVTVAGANAGNNAAIVKYSGISPSPPNPPTPIILPETGASN